MLQSSKLAMGTSQTAVLWGAASRIYSKQYAASLSNSYLVLSLGISLTVQKGTLLIFGCYAYLGISLLFTIFSHQLKKTKRRIFAPNIQYQYTKQIPLSNSFDSSQKSPLKLFFLPFFSEIIQFNPKMFNNETLFDLMRQFVSKIYYFFAKKSNWLLDLIFEIHVNKFQDQGKIFKKLSLTIRNSIILKVSIRSLLILLSCKVKLCRGGRYSIPRIAPLYSWCSPYSAEC